METLQGRHTHLLGSRVQLGRPKVAVWMNPSGTGDGIAPGSTELVVVGGMHIEEKWMAE